MTIPQISRNLTVTMQEEQLPQRTKIVILCNEITYKATIVPQGEWWKLCNRDHILVDLLDSPDLECFVEANQLDDPMSLILTVERVSECGTYPRKEYSLDEIHAIWLLKEIPDPKAE
ncbi:hypothetical protein [Hymenobacter jejuensis]|uniref:Uncharacterized protein n=1 Tax=Hymenobacter jejuensis TaxID=2502781 RepID=A0A5B8A3G8_9BACT|nr:hypothetical protein [Hymenobacter jejuensis]QDA61669.1 hypothetical protein FHG12_16890 [Hymenobacter jejuensis]